MTKKAFYAWAAATLCCMLVIFLFSSHEAGKSGEMSESLTLGLVGTFWRIFAQAGQEIPEQLLAILELILRKTAHLFLFYVLALCVTNTIRQITENKKRIFWISLCWCSLYAAIDEVHQYFVPGRSAMWQDWLIDTIGVLLGIGTVFYVARRKTK